MKVGMVSLLTYLVSIFIVTLLPQVCASPSDGDINWWCNQTPYPEQCKYHMNHIPFVSRKLISPISRKQFLSMAEQTALQEVNSALQFISSLETRVLNDVENSAWRNCLLFYNLTVYRLNKTLDTTIESTADDVQTWLSAAATNIRTCNEGFFDVNVTRNIYPLVISNNVTQLISNCLAVNFGFTQEKEKIKREALFTKSSKKYASLMQPAVVVAPDGSGHYRTITEALAASAQRTRKNHYRTMQRADCVVAQDGSGNYRTITEALAGSAQRTRKNFVIYVKQGIYAEIVKVQQRDIVLIGDGIDKTVITGNRKLKDGLSLYECATFKVSGDGFKAIGITFENTAGVAANQAVAVASTSDRSVFYNCAFKAYQDTLYVQSNRQFYKNCQIFGTVDFIFGNAGAVFQDCTIYARKPITQGGLVVTAQGRNSPHENTGITIHRGRIMAAQELIPFPQYKAFLGRPWGDFSRTVYLRSSIDNLVDPAGWLTWEGAPVSRYSTLDYGEFQNNGAGASTDRRVKWPGYHVIHDIRIAENYDVTALINGQLWLPATGVPFDAGI